MEPNLQIAPQLPALEYSELVSEFFANYRGRTLESYREGIKAFASWVGCPVDQVGEFLFSAEAPKANWILLKYRAALSERYAPATVNLRLSALRCLGEYAQTTGLIGWSLKIKGVKVAESQKDLSGPTTDEVRAILAEAANLEPPIPLVLWLAATMLLRRNEIATLRVLDWEPRTSRLAVLRKGKTERLWLTVPLQGRKMLQDWCGAKSDQNENLFGLNGHQIWLLVSRISKRAIGRHVHPHSLRHSGANLLAESKDPFAIQAALGHADLKTAQIYLDHREDKNGQATQAIADQLSDVGGRRKTDLTA